VEVLEPKVNFMQLWRPQGLDRRSFCSIRGKDVLNRCPMEIIRSQERREFFIKGDCFGV